MKSKWITYLGHKILYADYSNFGFDALGVEEELEAVLEFARLEPLDSVLTLIDVRGTNTSPEVFSLMRQTSINLTPHIKKRAVIGAGGKQVALAEMLNHLAGNKPYTLFDDIEKAKAWLIDQ